MGLYYDHIVWSEFIVTKLALVSVYVEFLLGSEPDHDHMKYNYQPIGLLQTSSQMHGKKEFIMVTILSSHD